MLARASWEASDAELSTGSVDKLGTHVDDTLAQVHTPWTTLWKQSATPSRRTRL